jgi:futalosine hydrolase
VDLLLTGVGMVATAYHLGRYFTKCSPDLAINAGIAGTFDPSLTLGSVVNVIDDQIGDFGAQEQDGFRTVFDLGLQDPGRFPFHEGRLRNIVPLPPALTNTLTFTNLIRVNGFTTNTIKETFAGEGEPRHGPFAGLESMEGAAFFYACISSHVPAVQLRAVSNLVGERDKSKWMIPLAIGNLNQTLKKMLIEIYQ